MQIPFLGKKKAAPEAKGRGYVPTDRVKELQGRGFSELDSIDVLRREGFSPQEIDKALESTMSTAMPPMQMQGMQPNVGQFPPAQSPQMSQPGGYPGLGDVYNAAETGTPYPSPSMGAAQAPAKSPFQSAESSSSLSLPTIDELAPQTQQQSLEVPETSLPDDYYQSYPTEEYIDYVVQEHMQEVNNQLSMFGTRYKELEQRIMEMSEHVKRSNMGQAGEQQKVLERIDRVDDNLEEVKIRVAGIEKAFKETLPALIESVRALSDIVQRMKREA